YKRRCCSLIPAEPDSSPHVHAQTTNTYYWHQDLRIKKASSYNDKQDQRSQSVKEQSYNIIKTKDSRTQRQSNLKKF
ncbi:hypothetical protein Tco_0056958, partial [Tanacetum coccineum]